MEGGAEPNRGPILVDERVERHKAPGRGTNRFSREIVYKELGVLRLRSGRGLSLVSAS